MTQQQVINYVKKKKDILPILQASTKHLTPNVQLAACQIDAYHLEYLLKIPNFEPIWQVQFAIVKKSPHAVASMQNPSEKLTNYALSLDGQVIKNLKNPSQRQIRLALKTYGKRIKYLSDPTKEEVLTALYADPQLVLDITHMPEITNPLKLRTRQILMPNGCRFKDFKYVNDPSEEVQMKVVSRNPNNIMHINQPTQKVKFRAVKLDPRSIEHIKNQSEDLQKLRLQNDKPHPWSIGILEDLWHPSQYIIKLRVELNPRAVRVLKSPSDEIKWLAIKKEPKLIAEFDNSTYQMQKYALQQYPELIKKIKNLKKQFKVQKKRGIDAKKVESDKIVKDRMREVYKLLGMQQ